MGCSPLQVPLLGVIFAYLKFMRSAIMLKDGISSLTRAVISVAAKTGFYVLY